MNPFEEGKFPGGSLYRVKDPHDLFDWWIKNYKSGFIFGGNRLFLEREYTLEILNVEDVDLRPTIFGEIHQQFLKFHDKIECLITTIQEPKFNYLRGVWRLEMTNKIPRKDVIDDRLGEGAKYFLLRFHDYEAGTKYPPGTRGENIGRWNPETDI